MKDYGRMSEINKTSITLLKSVQVFSSIMKNEIEGDSDAV